MSLTNFGALTQEELTIWKMETWKAARNKQFLGSFTGESQDSMVQRITELTKTKKGARAVITLVADLEGDGVAGDRTLEGNEEAMKSFDQVIRIDQLRHANRHEGKIAEQKSVVRFRKESRDVLAYWVADRLDQLGFLSLSGVSYSKKTNGADRVGSDLPFLDFAADVTAPSANRHRRWDATNGLVAGDTTAVEVADTPTWAMLVEAKAYAIDNFIKPIRTMDGVEFYNVFLTPQGIAKLKQDPDFLSIMKDAGKRGDANMLFKGTRAGMNAIFIDGLALHEFRHVYNTKGAPSGSKFGASGTVDGQRIIFAGAQALGFADLGLPEWVEKEFDYDNQPGISLGKICGMKKPVFRSLVTGTDEDFGVLVIDTAI